MNEINFMDLYLSFFKKIIIIYYKKFKYQPSHFFNIIENNINNFYLNSSQNIDEKIRENNLFILNKLIENNLLDKKLENLVNSIILVQNNYLVDIYHWFKNKDINESNKNKILIKLENIDLRTQIY